MLETLDKIYLINPFSEDIVYYKKSTPNSKLLSYNFDTFNELNDKEITLLHLVLSNKDELQKINGNLNNFIYI